MPISDINNADMTGGSRQTVATGACVLEVEEFSYKQRDPQNPNDSGESIFVEVIVREHVNPEDPVGSQRKISFTGLDQPGKGPRQWGRIRELMAVLYGIDPNTNTPGADIVRIHNMVGDTAGWWQQQDWGGIMGYVLSYPAIFKGTPFRADSFDKNTKKYNAETQKPFPFRIWSFSPYMG